MDTIVSRPTVETVEPIVKGDGKIDHGAITSKGNVPLEIYAKENSTPYIDSLLGVDNILPQNLKDSISSIDEYVTALMNKDGYNPTTEAYKATLEGLKKELGIDKNTSLETTVERLSRYIEAEGMLKKLKTVDESKILKELKKSPTESLIALVMKQVEKNGL